MILLSPAIDSLAKQTHRHSRIGELLQRNIYDMPMALLLAKLPLRDESRSCFLQTHTKHGDPWHLHPRPHLEMGGAACLPLGAKSRHHWPNRPGAVALGAANARSRWWFLETRPRNDASRRYASPEPRYEWSLFTQTGLRTSANTRPRGEPSKRAHPLSFTPPPPPPPLLRQNTEPRQTFSSWTCVRCTYGSREGGLVDDMYSHFLARQAIPTCILRLCRKSRYPEATKTGWRGVTGRVLSAPEPYSVAVELCGAL
ncbi:hypothetical protein QBC41DRAFT_17499 [Cercophora samala]|uniref:Uncharacterized protein n=1 Tax=Cercophora samala TaxID=330535 RepID=A0AA39Z5T1_9PEZI|nr:hypothetical protein QBC41DRAFT_17499 [Cercophora samala]